MSDPPNGRVPLAALGQAKAYELSFAFPAGDTAVGASLREYGEFGRVILDLMLDHADGAGSFLDVGANIGAMALPFASRRPAWRVVAIEAHPGLADILNSNVAANALANVSLLRAAAGAKGGFAQFPAPSLEGERNFGDIGFGDRESETARVLMVTLDDVAPTDTRLIKIDVEGYEPEVLAGSSALIDKAQAVWVVEASVQHPEATAETIAAFQRAGYEVCWFYAPFVTPTNGRSMPSNPARGDSNIVAIPPGLPNRWSLSPVGDPHEMRPRSLDAYPYLRRYGYVPA